RDFRHVDQIIERIVAVFFPGAVLVHLHQALQTDVPDARRHAAGLHRQAPSLLVAAFDARGARAAFLRRARHAAVVGLFVGASFHAFAIATAALLIDEHDAVLGAFVNRVARAGCQARRIAAMIANARKIKEPGLVLRQRFAAGEVSAFRTFLRAG